jgi:hypothetical protein
MLVETDVEEEKLCCTKTPEVMSKFLDEGVFPK